MKHEVVRLSNVMIRRGRTGAGPFYLKINRGELSGVVIDESFEIELIRDLFTGKSSLEGGHVFYDEKLVPPEKQANTIRRKLMKEVSIISGETRLFDSLSLVDNIFIPGFLLRSRKHRKIAKELMAFFDLDIPVNARPGDLGMLERIQIELLHAVANHHKVIFAVNINGKLRTREVEELFLFYDRLIRIGYSICLFESYSTMPLEKLDFVTVVEKGRCVGEYARPDIDPREIAGLVNAYSDPGEYSELIALRDRKLYSGKRIPILELKNLSCGRLCDFTLDVHKGELVQLFCRTRSDYNAVKDLFLGRSGSFEGTFLMGGNEMRPRAVEKAVRKLKIGYIDFSLLDRLLFNNLSLLENICYPLCLKTPFFFLHRKYRRAAADYIRRAGLMIEPETEVWTLTQEQAARVVLCKWLLCKPKLLILFVPASFVRIELDLPLQKILLELCMYGIPVMIVSERYKAEADIIETEYVVSEGRIVRRK